MEDPEADGRAPAPFDGTQRTINRSRLDNPHLLSAPFWGELRIFLAVAKARSLSGAAQELAMSIPTVSRQVRRLQDVLGSQLFISTQNSIKLTPKGEELADMLSRLDERLFEISRDLSAENRDAEGLVRISVTEALAGLFVAPAARAFADRYPKVQLHLQNPSNLTSFKENQTDIMVRFTPENGSVTSRPCGWMHFIPMAGRSYIEQFGMPTRANLDSHLYVDTEYYKSKSGLWQAWQNTVARGIVAHHCDNSFAYAILVRSGCGIGLLASYALVDSELVPLDLDVHIAVPICLMASTERLKSRPVRLAFDWLADVFSPATDWFSKDLDLQGLPMRTLASTAQGILTGPLANHIPRSRP